MKLKRLIFLVGLSVALSTQIFAQTNCTDFQAADFKKVDLVTGIFSPMKVKIATDGRIFYIQRSGEVMMLKPGTTVPVEALKLEVPDGAGNEDGLLGIALDPNFASNSWIYLYYTLATPMGYRVSRFTVVGDKLVDTSEKLVLNINHLFTKYGPLIIHGAGALAFDPQGNLLVTTGDMMNTTIEPQFQSPIVETNLAYDAQKTSANTNSFYGKVLRITPKADGTYSIPTGNLFAPGTENTLPEIYSMGLRNPFTLTIDPKTGFAYVGDVGPDGSDGAIPSQDEVNQIRAASNFGWPYLTGDNQPYKDTKGVQFNSAALVNNSVNNTGIKNLPTPVKSLFWYGYKSSWPVTGITPMAGNRCIKVGGFYRFNPAGVNIKRLPPAMDNGFFMANHNDNEPLRYFKLDDAGNLVSIKTVFTGLNRPISSEVGPDGSLFLLEWGGDNGHWFNHSNGKLSRIDYIGGCSTTSVAYHLSQNQNRKNQLVIINSDSKIIFPDNMQTMNVYDLKGTRLFTTKKLEVNSRFEVFKKQPNRLVLIAFN